MPPRHEEVERDPPLHDFEGVLGETLIMHGSLAVEIGDGDPLIRIMSNESEEGHWVEERDSSSIHQTEEDHALD